MSITVEGDGEIGYALPAFYFDGEAHTEITVGEHSLTVSYGGQECKYTTDGEIVDLGRTLANRNGHYHAYLAKGQGTLRIKIRISKA